MTGNALEAAPLGSPLDGRSRAIARQARAPDWRLPAALAALPEGGGALIGPTIAAYENELRPLRERDPRFEGTLSKSVADAFAPIGAKMRPDMSQEQAGFWTAALVKSWSDLPPFCVAAALEEAVHIPFQFPSDMEAKVRELAERKVEEHRTAIRRLHAMLDEIHRAANPPQPQLEAPDPEEPCSLDDIRKMSASLRRIGLQIGAIREEDLAIVQAEEAKERRSA